jgi:hypothetical protein
MSSEEKPTARAERTPLFRPPADGPPVLNASKPGQSPHKKQIEMAGLSQTHTHILLITWRCTLEISLFTVMPGSLSKLLSQYGVKVISRGLLDAV